MAMIDVRKGKQYSLNPFFEAGKAEAFIYAYRDEGTKYTASGFVSNLGDDLGVGGEAETIIVQSGSSGVQGFTEYQANIETIDLN